jgi:outer membrane protein OmpA-like peptidoglycan-associated protein
MNKLRTKILIFTSILAVTAVLFTSCKSKKILAVKENVVAEEPAVVAPIEKKEIDTDGDGIIDRLDNCPDEKGTAKNNGCPEVIEKAFNYKNIQFEFNSSVLKTSSYAALEEVAQEMKKHPKATFQLNGHSSAEGSENRNMMLSVDRANAVKAYLVNNGISTGKLTTKGFGETMLLVPNTNEENKSKNRRVEINPFY